MKSIKTVLIAVCQGFDNNIKVELNKKLISNNEMLFSKIKKGFFQNGLNLLSELQFRTADISKNEVLTVS